MRAIFPVFTATDRFDGGSGAVKLKEKMKILQLFFFSLLVIWCSFGWFEIEFQLNFQGSLPMECRSNWMECIILRKKKSY